MHIRDKHDNRQIRAAARDTRVHIGTDVRDSIESGQRLMRSIKAPSHDTRHVARTPVGMERCYFTKIRFNITYLDYSSLSLHESPCYK